MLMRKCYSGRRFLSLRAGWMSLCKLKMDFSRARERMRMVSGGRGRCWRGTIGMSGSDGESLFRMGESAQAMEIKR